MRRLILTLMLATLSTAFLYAQGDERWDELSIDGQFNRWYDSLSPGSRWFFSDTLHGYTIFQGPWKPPAPIAWFLAETTDGGLTWNRYERFVPIPHRLAGRFGYSEDGYITTDGGAAWRQVLDSTVVQLVATDLTDAVAPRYLVALHRADNTLRMSLSTDFGETWIHVDSAITTVCRLANGDSTLGYGLAQTTAFGPAPVDAAGSFAWRRIGGIHGANLLVLSANGASKCQGQGAEQFHLWRINLDTKTAEHRASSRVLSANLAGWSVIDSLRMVTYGRETSPVVFRSVDGGESWDSVGVFNVSKLYFRGAFAISDDRYSTDFGSTWRRWYNPFGTFSMFYAFDSLHLFGGGTSFGSAQVARSSDGGRTWSANGAAPSVAIGAIAHSGTIVVGAGPGVLLRSSDHGQTWVNRWRVPDAVPDGVASIGPIAMPDSAGAANRMLAAARFASFDSEHFELLESSDTGATWRATSIRFPRVDRLVFSPGPSPTGFLSSGSMQYTSSDGGASWQPRGQQLNRFVMGSRDNGIALLEGGPDRDGAVMRTTDGGVNWRDTLRLMRPASIPVGAVAFDAMRYAVILPDVFQRYSQQHVAFTDDAGASWRILNPRSDLSNILEPFFWLSPSHVYSAYKGGLRYSSDSGRAFILLRDSWPVTTTCRDDQFIYFVNLGGSILGRWRLDDVASAASEHSPAPEYPIAMRVLENPVVSGDVMFELMSKESTEATIRLIATDGSPVRVQKTRVDAATPAHIVIDVEGLPSGAYFVAVESPEGRCLARVVIQ
jgi:photosystem II stability/assembly factor-like uncharacterized protein